ncbi:MAG: RluA family pseudouridine synthase [Leptospiraceae bacterium]|nr:RluA family pseudouridine synthase [Leptospiraceae bacterium]MDW8307279.1 RluA family pseudouridine synthase [Leptospiraceae bacterium]
MKEFTFRIPGELEGQRLDCALFTLLQKCYPLSRSRVRKLIVAGAVYLNGRRVRIASKRVLKKAIIKIYLDEKRISQQEKIYHLSEKDIVYEDDYLICVNKPAGLLTVPSLDEARQNLFSLLRDYLKKRNGRKECYLGVHHRLDKETSGLVLFTKKEEVNPAIAELFQEHLVSKKYFALCHKNQEPIEVQWEVRNELVRCHPKKNKYRLALDQEEGSFAYSRFRLIEEREAFVLLQATPITGRTHQLRVHLASQNLPIVGDWLYAQSKEERLMLHSYELSFRHPITQKNLEITAPPDEIYKSICQNKGILYFTS